MGGDGGGLQRGPPPTAVAQGLGQRHRGGGGHPRVPGDLRGGHRPVGGQPGSLRPVDLEQHQRDQAIPPHQQPVGRRPGRSGPRRADRVDQAGQQDEQFRIPRVPIALLRMPQAGTQLRGQSTAGPAARHVVAGQRRPASASTPAAIRSRADYAADPASSTSRSMRSVSATIRRLDTCSSRRTPRSTLSTQLFDLPRWSANCYCVMFRRTRHWATRRPTGSSFTAGPSRSPQAPRRRAARVRHSDRHAVGEPPPGQRRP